jgi:hypothetical protein
MVEDKIKQFENEKYLDDLKRLLKTHSAVPTHEPKKLTEQFYLYKNDTTYRLYVYINNEWKYTNLS